MDSRRWSQIKSVFDEACELPPEQRKAFVEQACRDDAELVAEVWSLLSEEDSVHSLLDGVALDVAAVSDLMSKSGQRVGPYILKEQLGVGGMGEVYLAERADGQFEHQVALKLVRSGVHSAQILARFKTERQILARLKHPNIARLLDGGLTEDGRPYFVLEYVEGRPIDEYANANELGVDARLELFAQVCRAVTYAHANLVVHRDLKPSNILVNADGHVKLLDFGIAKVLSDETDDRVVTQTGSGLMTPAYGSPEQARGEPVNTATDIYSLGVVLYELLTGSRPYDVTNRNPLEVAQIICDVEPSRPSVIVGQSARDGTTTHGSDTGRLHRLLAGDLDVICLKALRKETDRRYTTSDELGEDIRRHLSGEPIAARSESWVYRADKFVRRHRVAAGFLVLLVLFSGFYTVRLAEEKNRAQREAERATQVSEFLQSIFEVADPTVSRGETLTAREILENGMVQLEDELADQPQLRAEMLFVVGRVFHRLALYEQALEAHEKALAIRQEIWDEPHDEISVSLLHTGSAYRALARDREADSLTLKGLEMRRELVGNMDTDVGAALNNLALTATERGEYAEAESLLVDAIEIHRTVGPPDGEDLLGALNNLARVYDRLGRFEDADSIYADVIDLLEGSLGHVHPHVATAMSNRAAAKRKLGDMDAAEELYRGALALRRQLYEPDHNQIGISASSLARFLIEVGGPYDEAEKLLEEAYSIRLAALGPSHSGTVTVMNHTANLYTATERYRESDSLRQIIMALNVERFGETHPRVASDLGSLSALQYKQGLYSEALATRNRALAMRRELFGDEHWLVAQDLFHLAEAEVALGRKADARRHLEESLEISRKVLAPDHPSVIETEELLGRWSGHKVYDPLGAGSAVVGRQSPDSGGSAYPRVDQVDPNAVGQHVDSPTIANHVIGQVVARERDVVALTRPEGFFADHDCAPSNGLDLPVQ